MYGVECCYIVVEMISSPQDSGYTGREITAFQLKGSVKVPGEFYKALFTLTGQAKCEVVIQSEIIFNFRIKKEFGVTQPLFQFLYVKDKRLQFWNLVLVKFEKN